MKIFRKAAAFLLTAVMLVSMAPQAEAAEEELNQAVPVPNAMIKTINLPIVVDKLLEGREAEETEVFTFHVEPVSELAQYYAENGYLTYSDTISVGTSVDPASNIAEYLFQSEIAWYEEETGETLTEEQIEAIRGAVWDDMMDNAQGQLSYFLPYIDTGELWSAGMIDIEGRLEINDNGVLFPLIEDGDYTFRITERQQEGLSLIDSKAVWDLTIHVEKADKWNAMWQETYTLTRVTDDEGRPDGTEYEIPFAEDGTAVPAVRFTNTYMEGNAVIQPADITVYMNGEEGCENVLADIQTGAVQSSVSLPETGYYVSLPDEIDAMLKEVWKDSGNVEEIVNEDGSKEYVLDLSGNVTLKDSSTGRSWTLEMFSSGYSMAYGKYMYRVVSADGQETAAVKFTDRAGNLCVSDQFSIKNALYEDYNMELFLGTAGADNITAEIRIAEGETLTIPVELNPGKLKVRYVTEEQSETVSELVSSKEEALPGEGALKQAVGMISPDTVFYINESQIICGDEAVPSLLFDDLVSSEDGARDYGELLRDTALKALGAKMENPQYDAKYIDLVDAHNGNAWLTADSPVTVYWPYPEGTDSDTEFYLVHFEGLNREMEVDSVAGMIADARTEAVEIQTDEYGISFTADHFSPYILLWDSPEPPAKDHVDSPSVKTGDVSYPAAWAVLAVISSAACICLYRKKYRR